MYVDITKQPIVTCVEWFHGYGGNALGLGRSIPGLCSVAVCERDAFVVANMVSKMEKGLLDAVPIWTDVTDFPTEPFGIGRLDFFAASYPCQGFSHAGKRLGVDDHRHLWPYCRKFIRAVRPGWVWLENVEGHVSLGLSTVLADLEEDGYTAAWGIFSASEVGAPHQRKRVFILAKDRSVGNCELPGLERGTGAGDVGAEIATEGCEDVAHQQQGLQGHAGDVHGEGREPGGADRPVAEESLCGNVYPSRPGASQYGWEPPRVVGNAGLQRQEVVRLQTTGPIKHGEEDGEHSQAQPPLGGNADGPADGMDFPGYTGLSDSELEEIYEWMVKGTNRTDELRMCGNGVVPQTAHRAFKTLYAELTGSPRPAVTILAAPKGQI